MPLYAEKFDHDHNPLDHVEDILNANNWAFDRKNDHELSLRVHGQSCEYQVYFIWQEDMDALQFCCEYNVEISEANKSVAAHAILNLNTKLWMGHFDVLPGTNTPCFRHTCLLRGMSEVSGSEQIEDLVDISLAQCERYFSVFHLLSLPQAIDDKTLKFALMNGMGEA